MFRRPTKRRDAQENFNRTKRFGCQQKRVNLKLAALGVIVAVVLAVVRLGCAQDVLSGGGFQDYHVKES